MFLSILTDAPVGPWGAGFSPFWIIPGVIGVLAWVAIVIVWIVTRNRSRGATSTTALADIQAKLDAIDKRLAVVEKAINEIP